MRTLIADGDTVRVFSIRGEVRMHAKVSDEVKPDIPTPPSTFP
jgi:anaerobic selenocysteine-containing dehydrogenase